MTIPLLLHSLHEYGSFIRGLLDDASAARVVEIGSETGASTLDLSSWCEQRGAELVVIEPVPAPDVIALADGSAHVTLVTGRSPGALEGLTPGDAYLIDGDHNYWTVKRELEIAVSGAAERGGWLLAILHDVGWPCARRDLYYDPAALPPEAVHPHTYVEGVRPGDAGTAPGGFRGQGAFAAARHEGGPANGVLTAIEDVLAECEQLQFVHVPAIFGLGVIWSGQAPWGAALADRLAPWAENALLERMERNRIELFLRVVELQDEVAGLVRRQHGALAVRDAQLAAANAELAALRLARARGGDSTTAHDPDS